MTRCCICHLPCVPMADYPDPVCPACDRTFEIVLDRAIAGDRTDALVIQFPTNRSRKASRTA